MITLNEKIVDLLTGVESIREYTAQEIKEVEAAATQAEVDRLAAEQEAADKAAARQAIFDRLGLTAEEAAVLGL